MDKEDIISLCNLLLVHYSNDIDLLSHNINYYKFDTHNYDEFINTNYKKKLGTSLYIVLKSCLGSNSEEWWSACMVVALFYSKINLIKHLLQDFSFGINTVLFNTESFNTVSFNTVVFKTDLTPLMYACKFLKKNTVDKQFDKQFEIIKLLLENGANICTQDNGLPLFVNIFVQSDYTHWQKIQLLDLFMAHGADIDDRGFYDKTLLMIICNKRYNTYQKYECVKYLIDQCGANPNLFDMYKNTVLMGLIQSYGDYHTDARYDAIEQHYNNMIELLIKYKVDVNAINIGKKFNALIMLYNINLLISTDLHLLLCTPQNISHTSSHRMNTMQYLCERMSTNNSRQLHLNRYLTDILSNFKPIDVLYDVLTSRTHHKIPALESIMLSKIKEHKILAQQLVCKVKRKELLTFNHAMYKITGKNNLMGNKIKLLWDISAKSRKDWGMHIASFLSDNTL